MATTALFSRAQFSLARFGVDTLPPTEFLLGYGVAGKLGRPDKPDPLNVHGIWQMRLTKRGKRPVKMRFYRPTNPRTPAQQANRQKFADAMAAWQALTPAQRQEYTAEAKKQNMFGWGLFIRRYYQSN